MPELPEVTTVIKKLIPFIVGKKITKVSLCPEKFEFLKELEGETLESIERFGKFLIFKFSSHTLLSHLRMEGKYFIYDDDKVRVHDVVHFVLDDGKTLVFNDTRKFGTFDLFKKEDDVFSLPPLSQLGKEPFDSDVYDIKDKIQTSNLPIKSLLLDQSIMSGIGNIYADEICFLTKLNPFTKGKELTLDDLNNIIRESRNVLNSAIAQGGSTIHSFKSFNNEEGHFQVFLNVHSREGEECRICGSPIIKTRIGGRGTYYCPVCQKDKHQQIIAITGRISSGKSAVLDEINKTNKQTFSFDKIYKEVLISSVGIKKELKEKYGTLDLSKIKDAATKSKDTLFELSKITHKYIFKKFYEDIEGLKGYIFAEVPVLFEYNYMNRFDKIIYVKASPLLRESLIKKRMLSESYVSSLDSFTLTDEQREKYIDYTINNNGSFTELMSQTHNLLKEEF